LEIAQNIFTISIKTLFSLNLGLLRYKETSEFIDIEKILYVISKKTGDYSLNLNIFPKNEMPNTNQFPWMQTQVC
jgi:hypothetical protein